jgi:signal transduction histidine kinase
MTVRLRDMMRQITHSRQLVAVGEFASRLSHEIRTPLTSLQLNLQAVNRGIRAGQIRPEMAKALDICLGEIRRLDRVVHGALALARESDEERSTFPVSESLTAALDVLRLQLDRQNVTATLEPPAGDDRVSASLEPLRSAFLNLLANAVEAMPDGGAIEIGVERMMVDAAPVVRVRIADTGPGVTPDDRERIFEPYFTTKPQGTGLGLALAAKAIEMSGGRITAQPRDDGRAGTVFVIDLPSALTDGVA